VVPLLAFTMLVYIVIGFLIMPWWNAVFALFAAFLGAMWAKAHAEEDNR
jgi:urea transporter